MSPRAPRVTIKSANAFAEIAYRGAELTQWQVAGRNWLHDGSPDWWPRSAPLLFPVVGKSRNDQVRIGGQSYPMPVHGFAATQSFELADASADTARFRLTENPATREHFPYAFLLEVAHRLREHSISLEARIVNTGAQEMPVAFGSHPAFVWPLPGGEGKPHIARFDRDVNNNVPRISTDGLFLPETRDLQITGRKLSLGTGECFADNALCFLGAGETGVRFGPEGGPFLAAQAHGFRHLALWSKPKAPFLSIEHWTARGDDVGAEYDLAERPDATILAPGDHFQVGASYRIAG